MTVGSKIRLVGKTKLGKERVKRDGDLFIVKAFADNVSCIGGKVVLVSPPNGNMRWIAMQNDQDFNIVRDYK